MKGLLDIVSRHKRGESAGVYSLCSAHPKVVESALVEARTQHAPLPLPSHPPIRRRVDNPMFVAGAIPATWLEYMR